MVVVVWIHRLQVGHEKPYVLFVFRRTSCETVQISPSITKPCRVLARVGDLTVTVYARESSDVGHLIISHTRANCKATGDDGVTICFLHALKHDADDSLAMEYEHGQRRSAGRLLRLYAGDSLQLKRACRHRFKIMSAGAPASVSLGPLGKMTGSPNPGEPTSTIQRFPIIAFRVVIPLGIGIRRSSVGFLVRTKSRPSGVVLTPLEGYK
ncbi:hypothetical protein KC347_g224 [Hortaea werneckii]|nr:hypothetical protein KC347_g224 [Hortaea werneckii]